jgi:6-phosphogluconolactonase
METKNDLINSLFFIGSINEPGPWFHPAGEGLTLCSLDERNGDIKRIRIYSEIKNPIWLTSINGGYLVARECYLSPGKINSFSIDQNYIITGLGDTPDSSGGAICHLRLTSDEKTLFVTSFLGGVSVHCVGNNQEVAPSHQVVIYEGHGPRILQNMAHPHQAMVTPDEKFLYVCDLGSDKIWVHAINKIGDKIDLGPAVGIDQAPGSGPRHMVFHRKLPLLYVLGQLDGQVRIYAYQAMTLSLAAIHNTLPADFKGEPEAAAIKWHPSGKTLYISNRNSNTITVFIVESDGGLRHADCFSAKGKAPRDFLISKSGAWLTVLNHDSDILIPFKLNPKTGLPTGASGVPFPIGCPVCGIFLT